MREIEAVVWDHKASDLDGQVMANLIKKMRMDEPGVDPAVLIRVLVCAELEMVRLHREEQRKKHGREKAGDARGWESG